MALTFTVSNLRTSSLGNRRGRTADIAITGTTTDNGDAFSPSAIGLSSIDTLAFSGGNTVNSTSDPESGFTPAYISSTGKIVFFSGAADTTTAPFNVVTDGTTITQTVSIFAIGK